MAAYSDYPEVEQQLCQHCGEMKCCCMPERKVFDHKRRPAHACGLDRADYWRFLRIVYGMGALEAWEHIKFVGTPPTIGEIQDLLD